MPLRELRELLEKNKRLRLSWKGGLAIFAGTILIALLFVYFGRFDLAAPTLFSILVIVVAIKMKWELRKRVWFWAAMVAITALHISLIVCVPWTTRWIPALLITPILVADLAVILAIIIFLEKQFEKAPQRDAGASSLD